MKKTIGEISKESIKRGAVKPMTLERDMLTEHFDKPDMLVKTESVRPIERQNKNFSKILGDPPSGLSTKIGVNRAK